MTAFNERQDVYKQRPAGDDYSAVYRAPFSPPASGGAVIISQYIGSKDNEQAGKAASQLLMFSVVSSVVISVLILVFERPLLNLLFGRVEDDVMAAAWCRGVGGADVSMYISAFANAVNVVGNIIGVFVLHAGVAGVAYPSLIARAISAVAVTWYCFMHRKTPVRYTLSGIFAWHGSLLKKDVSCLYDCHRSVHGRGRYGRGKPLFQKAQ